MPSQIINRGISTQWSTRSSADPLANTNKQTRTQTDRQKQWGGRWFLSGTVQPIAIGTVTQVGFSSQDYMTYQALGQAKYPTIAQGSTIGAIAFNFTSWTVPYTGIYQVNFLLWLTSSTAGAWIDVDALIQINGSTAAQETHPQVGGVGLGFACSRVIESFNLQAGAVITCAVFHNNAASVAESVGGSASGSETCFSLRYLGEI